MVMIDVVFADIHIGLPTSCWKLVLTTLQGLISHKGVDVGAVIFAGDTVDITRAQPQQVAEDFTSFCEGLEQIGLMRHSVFLYGNHDPTINRLFKAPDCLLRPAVLLRHPDTSFLIVHGNNIGLEGAIARVGSRAEAFAAVKDDLLLHHPPWLPGPLSPDDWLVAGHYSLPHVNLHTRTAGLSPWTDPINDHWHGHYLIIYPHSTRPPLTLHKNGKQISI